MNNKHKTSQRIIFSFTFFALSSVAYCSDPAAPFMEFIKVPGGCFQMGSDKGETHERPVHKVCVKDFELGKYEVTQAQWEAVMGRNPSRLSSCGANCPVDSISWNDAQTFVKALNARSQGIYRLPTEAEWEYACRDGGKDQEYAGAIDEERVGEIAWYKTDGVEKAHPVGLKKPNALGLYDMNGNVWEWTQDVFSSPYLNPILQKNPVFDARGESHTIRGGSWNGKVRYVRCAIRNRYPADHRDFRIGLRVVREAESK